VLVGLAFTRLISFLAVAPFFGGAAVPARVKAATAAALVIIVYPIIEPNIDQGFRLGPIGFIALLIKEALVGFSLGFLASLVFEAISMAGRIIDIQRGSAMAELFAPQLEVSVSEMGQFQLQFAIVLFLLIGAHRVFIGALLESFHMVPATGFPDLSGGFSPLLSSVITLTGQMIAVSVQLAAPPMIALLLTDLFFGMVNRSGDSRCGVVVAAAERTVRQSLPRGVQGLRISSSSPVAILIWSAVTCHRFGVR
jgi:flagellar biosynthetic protein FliR